MEGSTVVRVRYAETDKMGVVYYANYFVWFEVGRCELLRAVGWSYREMEAEGIQLPVIEASCEYRQPGRYDDELEIRARGRVVSPARIAFEYDVIRCADGALLARGRTVHAAIGAGGRPTRVPQRVREVLA
jgi:acyl-CoA thioester hydrolase